MTIGLTPSDSGSATNPAGGKIGAAGTNDFVIYMWDYPFDFFSETFESTGGGDALPVYSNSGEVKGRVSISGIAVASQAIGIANLIDSEKNPAAVEIILSGDRKHAVTMFIERIRGRWRRQGPFMPITLIGYIHNTNPTNIEAVAS